MGKPLARQPLDREYSLGSLFKSRSSNKFDFFTLVLPLYPIAILGFGVESHYQRFWVLRGVSGFTFVVFLVVGAHEIFDRLKWRRCFRNSLVISIMVSSLGTLLSIAVAPNIWKHDSVGLFFHFSRNVIWVTAWTILAMKVKSSARRFFRTEKLIEAQRVHETRIALIQGESIKRIKERVEGNIRGELSTIFNNVDSGNFSAEKIRNFSHDILINSEIVASDYHDHFHKSGQRRTFLFYSIKSLKFLTINPFFAVLLFGSIYEEVLGLRASLFQFLYAAVITFIFFLSLVIQKFIKIRWIPPWVQFLFFGILQFFLTRWLFLSFSRLRPGFAVFHFSFLESLISFYLYFLVCGYLFLFQAGKMQSRELDEAFFTDLMHDQYENKIVKGEVVTLLREWAKLVHGAAQAKALQLESMLDSHSEVARSNARLIVYEELQDFIESLQVEGDLDDRSLEDRLLDYISPWRALVEIELDLEDVDQSRISLEHRSRIAAAVQDGIVNAFRHGAAKKILVNLYGTPTHHHLEMKNDGSPLQKGKKLISGLGSQNFDFISSGAWSLSNVDGYVVLKVAFPI